MKDNRNLKFFCPHCAMEYIMVGVDVEQVQNCFCHVCKGYCDIVAMSASDMAIWLK